MEAGLLTAKAARWRRFGLATLGGGQVCLFVRRAALKTCAAFRSSCIRGRYDAFAVTPAILQMQALAMHDVAAVPVISSGAMIACI
jgi:hypothetical protein